MRTEGELIRKSEEREARGEARVKTGSGEKKIGISVWGSRSRIKFRVQGWSMKVRSCEFMA